MSKKRKKALIIEDEDSWVDLLSLLLAEAGYEILKASNGREGLRHAKAHRLDLMIVDIGLPDTSGTLLLKQLEEHQAPREVPVIVLSAYHREEVSDLDFGGAVFVSKDQGLPPLITTLTELASSD